MKLREDYILTVAEIVQDAAATNDAALAEDFDEARFRAQLVVDKLEAAGLSQGIEVALRVVGLLGPMGTPPRPGYGEAMLRLADALDSMGFDAYHIARGG